MNVIRQLRKESGLKLYELAERVQLDISTVSRIETGNRRLYVEELPIFAAALGCKVADLLPADALTPVETGG